MVLAIKIRDNIKANNRTVAKITFGEGYFNALNAISGIFSITDDWSFSNFANDIFSNFNCLDAFNLYYLADSDIIANTLITQFSYNTNSMSSDLAVSPESLPKVENILNHFGFEIEHYPDASQFTILENLKSTGIIDYYWIEGNVSLPTITTPTPINYPIIPNTKIDIDNGATLMNVEHIAPVNNFEKELKIINSNKRGLGATIISFEQDATDNIPFLRQSTELLSDFGKNSSSIKVIGQFNREGNFYHQIATLATIFGKTPITILQPRLRYNGVSPEANAIIIGVNLPKNSEKKDFMPLVRKKLFEIISNKITNGILLIEFEADFFNETSIDPIGRYPISIFKDITNTLSLMTSQNNTMVVMGAGNIGVNFDDLSNPPWASEKPTYNDLSKNNEFIIMVGAASKNERSGYVANVGTLLNEDTNNISASFDVYMYTGFAIIGINNGLKNYRGTSASVALAAGIIAFLQGKTTQSGGGNRPVSTKDIKKVFKNTFLKKMKFPKNVLTPIVLEDLWIECQKVMRNPRA